MLGLSRDDVERLILERSQRVSRHTQLHEVAQLRGLRPDEVVALRLDSIDWERELLQVHQSKTASRLTLPLAEHTLQLLRACGLTSPSLDPISPAPGIPTWMERASPAGAVVCAIVHTTRRSIGR